MVELNENYICSFAKKQTIFSHIIIGCFRKHKGHLTFILLNRIWCLAPSTVASGLGFKPCKGNMEDPLFF